MNPWPMIWRFDNAWANMAHLVVDVLPAKGVYLEYAMAKRPESKPVAESGYSRDQRIHEDLQPNSVQRHPSLLAGATPERYAAERGITPEDVENDFVLMAVDGTLHAWSERAGIVPMDQWTAGDVKYWHRTYLGDVGQLYRDLKRRIGSRKVAANRSISYNGRDYVEDWAEDKDTDPRNDLQ